MKPTIFEPRLKFFNSASDHFTLTIVWSVIKVFYFVATLCTDVLNLTHFYKRFSSFFNIIMSKILFNFKKNDLAKIKSIIKNKEEWFLYFQVLYFILFNSMIFIFRNLKLKAHIQDCAVSKVGDFVSWISDKQWAKIQPKVSYDPT